MSQYYATETWLRLFETNAGRIHRIQRDSTTLTAAERERITRSIQDFQLGESSEGHTLRRYARAFAETYDIPSYAPLMDLFIAEENRHSVYLARFMKQHGIARQRKTVNDALFRWLRSRIGIELSIRTLVTAEIVALTYYQCLAVATGSPVLAGICAHMLDEEEAHVSFQMQHIQFINLQKRGPWGRICDLLHRILLGTALLAVWFRHRPVLRMRHSFWSFLRAANGDFSRILREGRKNGAQMFASWRLRQGDTLNEERDHVCEAII